MVIKCRLTDFTTYVINDQAFGANSLFMGNCLDVKVIREKFWTCPKELVKTLTTSIFVEYCVSLTIVTSKSWIIFTESHWWIIDCDLISVCLDFALY